MAGISDVFSTVTGWVKDVVNFGLALVLVFLVIEILFGTGTTDIVQNLATFVDSFVAEGVIGLIIFIIVLAIYSA